jgi:hypothetical protein
MTAILFANHETASDTPAPKQGRAANSRVPQAKPDRRHEENIATRPEVIKRSGDSSCRGLLVPLARADPRHRQSRRSGDPR